MPRVPAPLSAVTRFLDDEAAGGIALLVGTVAALIWANAAGQGYAALWATEAHIGPLRLDLHAWIDDGAMTLFFFVVGLEIKRELAVGELADRRAATLPVVAATCGVALPALIFLAVTAGTPASDGWAIPAATDIAFAVGVLALLGDRVPAGARLLLLTVAIVDDVLAIALIALFYSSGLELAWLLASAACLVGVLALRGLGVSSPWAYVVPGLLLWLCVHESGVHATLAGVALGLSTPARPVRGRPVIDALQRRLHPVSAFVVVPLFALANAGVELSGEVVSEAIGARLTWAVIGGLVVGKLIGIAGGTALALRLGIGTLPDDVSPRHVVGIAAMAGIGFTVSIFVAGLAYSDELLVQEAKLGIFAGSLVSAILGIGVLLRAGREEPRGRERRDSNPRPPA